VSVNVPFGYCGYSSAVLNLCRVKLRDQERLERIGYLCSNRVHHG
jgi:hypothetical protein